MCLQFPRNRRRLDGRDNRCKRCTARMVAERLKQREPITAPTGESASGAVFVSCIQQSSGAAARIAAAV